MSQDDEIKIVDLGLLERLDHNIRPQDDLFGHVNSKWLAANPIPPTQARWGISNVLHEKSLQQIKDICEELTKRQDLVPGSEEQQIRDFYLSGMNFDKNKKQNLATLKCIFKKIDTIKLDSLSGLIGYLHKIGVSCPWLACLDADDLNSKIHILRLRQGGLTLPDRDYYLSKAANMIALRASYQQFVEESQKLVPELSESADILWNSVWGFELSIARKSRTSVQLRDVEKNYKKTTYKKLKTDYPAIDWDSYAKSLDWKADNKITVDQPEFFDFINDSVTKIPLEQWKVYLKWQVFVDFAGRVSEELAQHKFAFFGKELSGTETIPPLWKRVVSALNGALGKPVGKIYSEKHFPSSSKRQVLKMVDDIRDTYAERIMNLDWMRESTKKHALKKLSNIKVLIGFPEKWRSYKKLRVTPESYLANTIAAAIFENSFEMKRLHQPVSRNDWFMDPQTVNAYHDPNRLVICFPAAILQPPFFDPDAPYALNLGGIGSVIGHELTHGFDDQGCHFDADGNMREWQTTEDKKAFTKRAKVIIDQANKFEVLPGLYLRGGLIIGESIADLGGIEIALDCLKKAGKQKSNEYGLSDIELFFIGHASFECSATKEGLLRQYTLSDPHPDDHFRINGMVQHSDDFHAVYKTKPGDKLYRAPADRAKIW